MCFIIVNFRTSMLLYAFFLVVPVFQIFPIITSFLPISRMLMPPIYYRLDLDISFAHFLASLLALFMNKLSLHSFDVSEYLISSRILPLRPHPGITILDLKLPLYGCLPAILSQLIIFANSFQTLKMLFSPNVLFLSVNLI